MHSVLVARFLPELRAEAGFPAVAVAALYVIAFSTRILNEH